MPPQIASGRQPYTIDEDNLILKWIIKSKLFYALRGKNFWKDLSQANVFHNRSWQSLQNRFEKKVNPDISNPRYTISELDKAKITLAWQQTADNFDSNESGSDDNADKEENDGEDIRNSENSSDTDASRELNIGIISTDSENEHVTSTVDST